MQRTTIVIPEELLRQLRRIATDQVTSTAAVMRNDVVGQSACPGLACRAACGRAQPRPRLCDHRMRGVLAVGGRLLAGSGVVAAATSGPTKRHNLAGQGDGQHGERRGNGPKQQR